MMSREIARAHVRRGWWIVGIGFIGIAWAYFRAIVLTPAEVRQGLAQKILYVHVPSALMALFAFLITGILSLLYLWVKDRRMDAMAAASAEVGVAFGTVMLTTGPLWGKPVWGTYWEWDARLTTTLLLYLMFVGYMMMRGSVLDHEMRARFSAVFGGLGLVLVPFIHMTVYWFRTIHPQPVILKPEGPTMPWVMEVALYTSGIAFLILYSGFLKVRYGLMGLEDLRERELHGDA
jgi:heme exporter protein C